MNGFYACDTSQKIKSALKAKGIAGKHITGQILYPAFE